MSGSVRWLFMPLLLGLASCVERPADSPGARHAPGDLGTQFDPAAAGAVTGTLRWAGTVPHVEPFRSLDEPLSDQPVPPARDYANPNAPRVDPITRSVAGAVVLLRGVAPQAARPWPHPAPRVELHGQRFRLSQGGEQQVGFARVGEPIDFVSRDDRLHVAQGRGAAFFSIALPRPNLPRIRRFDRSGVVELRSGSGYFWMRAYLHVSDHPYLTRTDPAGRFRLDDVPAGEYDLVAWHPDWRVASESRNPDLFRVQQVEFRPPLRSSCRVAIRPGQTAEAALTLGP